METDKQHAIREIKEEIATIVVSATQTILHEKLDQTKDKKLIEQALQKASV